MIGDDGGSKVKPERRREGGPRFVDDYLLALLARSSHAASAEFHARLGEAGIPPATWRVLASLQGVEAMTVGELARVALLKQPTLTKTFDRLEAAGLIERRAATRDRRRVVVRLAPAGAALAAALTAEARAHEEALMDVLGDEGEALKAALRRLIALLERRTAPPRSDLRMP